MGPNEGYTLDNLVDTCIDYFVIESGLITELKHNLIHIKPDVSVPGFTARAATDSDGMGYIELTIDWPKRIFWTEEENGNQVIKTEKTCSIEVHRDGVKIFDYSNYSQNPSPTVVLNDRYELTQGTTYKYRVIYNWKWDEQLRCEKIATATANGFSRPPVVCPTVTFDGRSLICEDKKAADITAFYDCLTQAEKTRIRDIDIRFNFYDENQPNDYSSTTRIYTGFSYNSNENTQNCWSQDHAGKTRKLNYSCLRIFTNEVTPRLFEIPGNQLLTWAQEANFPVTLQIAATEN